MKCACYRFSLSMQSTQSQVSLPILLNDTGRKLLIKLVDNGKPYFINDGCRAVFYAKKADGNILINDCIIEKNAKIRYDFTAQTASAAGISKCEIRLYGANGRLITSPKFIMVIDSKVVYDDQVIASYNEFTTLDAIIATEHSRAEAEKARSEAEEARAEAEKARNERVEEALAKIEGSGGGTVTDEQIATAVESYLEENPVAGIDGKDGKDGTDGKSAYEYAQDGGYTGTEEEFGEALANAVSGGNVATYDGTVEVV